MLICFILSAWLQGNTYHYLDGVTFRLLNGTEIRTVSEITENAMEYTWKEGLETVNLPKQKVESITYFSMRVKGNRPYKQYRTASMRRISGKPVVYNRDGLNFLRCRHIDFRGRSAEGRGNANQVRELQVAEANGENREIRVTFARVVKKTLMTFRFYDLKGARLFEKHASSTDVRQDPRGKQPATITFSAPASLDPKTIGLVEVVTIPE